MHEVQQSKSQGKEKHQKKQKKKPSVSRLLKHHFSFDLIRQCY